MGKKKNERSVLNKVVDHVPNLGLGERQKLNVQTIHTTTYEIRDL